MARYHIKKDGTPGICRAKVKPCPYGGDSEHFDNEEEAQKFADRMHEYVNQHKYGNKTVEELETEFKVKHRDKFKSGKEVSGAIPVDISKYQFKNYLNPDGQDMQGRKTFRETLESVSEEVEKAFSKISKRKSSNQELALRAEFDSINYHSTFRDLVVPSSEQGLKDAKRAIQKRQRFLIEEIRRLNEEK